MEKIEFSNAEYIGKKKKKTTSCKIVYIYKFLDIYFILIYDDEKMILYKCN